ncbi:MAG: hypothetical protein AVDCRST_MAG70-1875 [uncultured Thermomicrobiales bacterium]|uniref:Uncharacterized protein n=1 Tax=uncultured Thermomicrobiales bacterium TaxID=1645740 RepID=A0A6J4V0U1_9BACT|nr:MAG: hypothetical protein AVDCRST_MAG70-1875 [uncultured Thermomicrobiales bacterium]
MDQERRSLFPEEEAVAEPGIYGCPMLIRPHHDLGGRRVPTMRCALGWALHDEGEIDRCARTGSVAECWKVDPALIEVVPRPGPRPHVVPGPVAETSENVRIAGD